MTVARAGVAAIRRRPGRPPGPSQAAEIRERLLAESSALYADGGFAGLSFGALAERTGFHKATLFHYFPSKDALLYAIFQRFGERLEAATVGWFDPPPATHAARLGRVVASLVAFYGADPQNARILCHGLLETERLRPTPFAGPHAPPVFTQFVQRFGRFIRSGIEAGEFHPGSPPGIILALGGLVLFEFMVPDGARLVYGAEPVDLDRRSRELTVLVRRMVVRPAFPERRRSR